jgi:hypothetical protein
MTPDQARRRSVGYLEQDDETWACFLVTFMGQDQRWRGYLSFRPTDGGIQEAEIRTADIFLEASESAIDHKARSLGNPLLSGLLSSALHTRKRYRESSSHLRKRFQSLLSESSREAAGTWMETDDGEPGELDLARLQSLYASYRLDQVAHFIALVEPQHFDQAVDRILSGASVDFGAKDRVQFAMMVVEHVERLLGLPPFDVWAEDYLANREEYALYAHTLHREGRLP